LREGSEVPVPPRLSDAEFLSHCVTDGDCLIYLDGYGRPCRASRQAWRRYYGWVPVGFWVLHRCDRAACIRREHLYLGTRKDNMRDAVVRGCHPSGERNGQSKLTEADVHHIYEVGRLGPGGNVHELSRELGVTPGTVHRVLTGYRWKHLGLAVVLDNPLSTALCGELNGSSRLTPELVHYIRRTARRGHGGNVAELAKELGVSLSAVTKVLNGRSWRHLKEEAP
jgi:DNA-binding MarR family transcriptional regulator